MSLLNKNQRFLASTRGQIITLLRRASRTVNELAQALELTDNAVRAHLAALERDGIVQQRGVRRGGGKPSIVYELAPEAEQLFPKAYDPVLQQLLEVLGESMPSGELETLLREVGRRMAEDRKVPSGKLRTRLEAAVEVYNKLGGMAEVEACDGHSCIRSYSCPFAAVVPGHPAVCRLAETLLSELVGVPIEQHCEHEGSQRCFFTVLNT